MDAIVVERPEISVMFKRASDEQESITRGWAELEAAVGSLKGRKFYGTFDPKIGEYRVCVELQEGDSPEALGLETGTIAGGRYAQHRLRGEPPDVYRRIAPTFQELAQTVQVDESRPGVEFYRRHDEIELLLPIT